ncbi:MAG: hypothetical protein LBL41_00280 [Bifidobacteriaceae bacterium]|jgi:hypothetical protein|nr:hypothetical protein [Bifidobacteriaceae bacterium]
MSKQRDDVIEALEKLGGYATFGKLNQTIDFTKWITKTPEASVRRIVQDSTEIFRIRKGLWGLESKKREIMAKLGLDNLDESSSEKKSVDFTHSYFQGLLTEIGKMQGLKTYVPAQDKNKLFLETKLGEIADTTTILPFTYEKITNKARTVDAIWFNKDRDLPNAFFEVEHSTDIKNALSKFYELQDFRAKMIIVADVHRKPQFDKIMTDSLWRSIRNIVTFQSYDKVVDLHKKTIDLYSLGEIL